MDTNVSIAVPPLHDIRIDHFWHFGRLSDRRGWIAIITTNIINIIVPNTDPSKELEETRSSKSIPFPTFNSYGPYANMKRRTGEMCGKWPRRTVNRSRGKLGSVADNVWWCSPGSLFSNLSCCEIIYFEIIYLETVLTSFQDTCYLGSIIRWQQKQNIKRNLLMER